MISAFSCTRNTDALRKVQDQNLCWTLKQAYPVDTTSKPVNAEVLNKDLPELLSWSTSIWCLGKHMGFSIINCLRIIPVSLPDFPACWSPSTMSGTKVRFTMPAFPNCSNTTLFKVQCWNDSENYHRFLKTIFKTPNYQLLFEIILIL